MKTDDLIGITGRVFPARHFPRVGNWGWIGISHVRTPQWPGWMIQRPEIRRIHHHRDAHAFNYTDFPP